MPLWTPQKGVVRVQHNAGTVGSATPGTSVTTGAASSTKGTPAELIASTSFDSYWLRVTATNYGVAATACQGAMDILVGAATEEVLIANLLMGHAGSIAVTGKGAKSWDFPIYIPAGTRIACQAAGARVSTAMRVCVYLYGGTTSPPWRCGSHVTSYGITTVPRGTTITPGASGAEGSWTEITASTSSYHWAFVPSFQVATDTTVNLRNIYVDIGAGAATEEEIGQSYIYSTDGGEFMSGPTQAMPAFADVPASTRLVMRASNSGTNDASYDGMIHAIS